MKVATVVGARPQFIKLAPVSRAIRAHHDELLIHTGQHYDPGMSQVFFDELGIPAPDHHLGIGSGGHGQQTGLMLQRLEQVYLDERPDAVLVFGDTNSTLAAALAAAKLHIPVGHVEAGLRSFDRTMPEEVNRVVTDHVSTGLYAPTQEAVEHLTHEGITNGVHLVGDVMVDAYNEQSQRARDRHTIVDKLGLERDRYWLATVHRPANTDDKQALAGILDAFREIEDPILFAMHPRTRKMVETHGLRDQVAPNVHVVEPLSYLDMIAALSRCKGVLTDSGGLQKEAYIAGRPCITLRTNTEWNELVRAGWNRLVGADKAQIVQAAHSFRPTGDPLPIYGDGHAADRIAALVGEL